MPDAPPSLAGTFTRVKAILIDPWQRSLETIEIPKDTVPLLLHVRGLVRENALDFAYVAPGEAIAVGDHSALQDPPLPSWQFAGYQYRLFGRGVVMGHTYGGKERDTRFTVDDLSKLIEFQ